MKKMNISKKITIIGSALALLFLGANMTACTDCCEDLVANTPSIDGGNEDGIDDSIEEIEGEDLSNPKQYFENTARLVMNYFDANKQKDVARLLMDFNDIYGEYVIDSTEVDAIDQRVLTDFSRNTARAIYSGNYAAARGVDLWSLADYSGIFEPNAKSLQWERTGKSNDLIFKFDIYGSKCELKVVASNGDWSAELNDKASAKVPKTLTFTLTQGSTTHMTGVMNSDYSASNHTFTITENATIADLTFKGNINGNDNEITAAQFFLIGRRVIAKGNATITGSQLCDRDAIQNAIENDNETFLETVYRNGVATTDILGRVQTKGEINSIYDIIEAERRYDDAWDEFYDKWWGANSKYDILYNEQDSVHNVLWDKYYSGEYTYDELSQKLNEYDQDWNLRYNEMSEEQDKEEDQLEEQTEKQLAEDFNNIMKCWFEFARNGQKQGDIFIKAVYEEESWGGDYIYTWWECQPVLQFNDGSLYGFEEYFGNGNFTNTENIFTDLVDTYKKVLDIE